MPEDFDPLLAEILRRVGGVVRQAPGGAPPVDNRVVPSPMPQTPMPQLMAPPPQSMMPQPTPPLPQEVGGMTPEQQAIVILKPWTCGKRDNVREMFAVHIPEEL